MTTHPETLVLTETLLETLTPMEHVEAALLYGSTARGDAETYSDIDLLVLCPVGKKRQVYDEVVGALARRFERISLSVYSKREFNFLSNAKSLFLLHLSRESIVLLDRTGWTSNLISHFEPKQSYDEDFKKSHELLVPLQSAIVGAPNQLHRLAYAYSLFRVFGVYLLAKRQIFEFSKARMVQGLLDAYPNYYEHIKYLSELRVLNANFFSGGNVIFDRHYCAGGYSHIERSVEALNRMAESNIRLSERPYTDAVGDFLNIAVNYPRRLGYCLRTWFLLLVYDGINLYLSKDKHPILTSFSELPLLTIAMSDSAPEPIRRAASLGCEYLRNYPLKYFLLEDSKIDSHDAFNSLLDLRNLMRTWQK